MEKNNPFPLKTSFRQKITIMLFGIVITLTLLEIGLRLGGFILISAQEHRNLKSIKQRGEYRILCLGDSTTQDQFPSFLGAFLNQKNIGIRFIVIDKEMPGAASPAIVNKAESYLDTYHPDMVVVMMGINDRIKALCPWNYSSKIIASIKSMRTYKLISLFWERALKKANKLSFKFKKSHDVRNLNNKNEVRLNKALILNPRNDVAHARLGWLYQRQGRYLEAEEHYKKALELNPRNVLGYIGLGWLTRAQGQLSKAEGYFKKALEVNPKSDWAYAELGWLYRIQGLLIKAEECDKKALEFNPKSTWAYLELGMLKLLKGQLPEAKQYFKKSLKLYPRNDWAYASLGWFYRVQDRYLEAEEYYKKALKLNPRNDLAYMELGWLCQAQGQLSKAKEYIEKALELNPRNDSAYVDLGLIYQTQGQLLKTEECLKKALDLNPRNDSACVNLGFIYQAQGLLTKAEESDKKALELNPKNTWAYFLAGSLYQNQKQYVQAEEYFKKALEVSPKNDSACLELVWLCRMKGNLTIAEEYLKKSLESKLQNKLRLYAALSSIYDEAGQNDLALIYYAETKKIELNCYNPITMHYYNALKKILDKRSIGFICVQYPLRSAESLKNIFQEHGSIIVVDNERVFKEAVKRQGYKQYFINMLGGNFGQSTPEGDKLLAENIARAILKEVFGKRLY